MIRSIMERIDRLSPAKRRMINVAIVIIVAFGFSYMLLIYIIPYLTSNSSLATKSVTEAVASVAVVATVTVTTINLIAASMNKRYSSKKQLTLDVSVNGSKAIITSTIEALRVDEGKNIPKTPENLHGYGLCGLFYYFFQELY